MHSPPGRVLTDTEARSPSADEPREAGTRHGSLRPVEAAVVAVAVATGLVLRFWTHSHLWLDEALTVDIARLPLGDIGAALRQDGHPPLYYVLLHGWMDVFGQSDIAVRALSGVFAVIALPLGWLAGRRAGGPRAGWAFVVLLSLSPFAIRYGTETRMYSLLMVLVLAGYLLVRNALERPSFGRLAGITLVSGALLFTHYWAMWLLGSTIVVLAIRAWRHRRSSQALASDGSSRSSDAFTNDAPASDVVRTTTRVLIAIVLGGVLFLPWLPSMLSQAAHTGTPWAGVVRPTTMVTESLQDFGGGDFAEGVLLGWGLLALFLLGLLAAKRDGYRLELDLRTQPQVRREAAVVGLTLVLAALAEYVTGTTFATRYAAVIFPLFLIVAAIGLLQLDMPVVLPIVVATLLVVGLVGGVHNVVTDRTQAGDVAAAMRPDLQPGDLVVICPDQLGPSMHRLLPASISQVVYPTFGSPDRVDWRDYAERNAKADPKAFATEVVSRASATQAHSVWLVESGSYETFEGQCEALVGELGAQLGGGQVVVSENGDRFFEHAGLARFPGPAAK
jgi:hypothetical protein